MPSRFEQQMDALFPPVPELPKAELPWLLKNIPVVQSARQSYNNERGGYAASRKTFEKLTGTPEPVQRDPFIQAAETHGAANAAFDRVHGHLQLWHKVAQWLPIANRTVAQERADLAQHQQTLLNGQRHFESKTEEVDVPKTHHLAWVGGVPGPDVMRSAKLWASLTPDVTVNVWTDKNNLLANDFKRATKALRPDPTTAAPSQDSLDPAVEARINAWSDVTKDSPEYVQGIDARLRNKQANAPAEDPLNYAELAGKKSERDAGLETFKAEVEQLNQHLTNGSQVRVRDVSELFENQPDLSHGHGSETVTVERNKLRAAYQCEVGERCNFAAAGDIARVVALHDEPGLYTDVDITPPVKGLPALIKTWNDALPEQHRKSHGIDPQKGIHLAHDDNYFRLISAVEEHVNHKCFDAPASNEAYEELMKGARAVGVEDKMRGSFDAWRDRTNSLQETFEPRPELKVNPQLFKMLQSGVLNRDEVSGANINSVLASSRQGAAALVDWSHQTADVTKYATQTLDEKRQYFDDSKVEQFKKTTIDATGPGSLMNLGMRDTLNTVYGVPMLNSPLFMIPHTTFPHPSTAERDSSWQNQPAQHVSHELGQQQEHQRGRRRSTDAQPSISTPQRNSKSPPRSSSGTAARSSSASRSSTSAARSHF